MTTVLAVCVAVIVTVSVYLMLSRELKSIAMGVFLLGHGANLAISQIAEPNRINPATVKISEVTNGCRTSANTLISSSRVPVDPNVIDTRHRQPVSCRTGRHWPGATPSPRTLLPARHPHVCGTAERVEVNKPNPTPTPPTMAIHLNNPGQW